MRDIRSELKKYGNNEPGKKFIEELKLKQKSLSEKQHSVIKIILFESKSF